MTGRVEMYVHERNESDRCWSTYKGPFDDLEQAALYVADEQPHGMLVDVRWKGKRKSERFKILRSVVRVGQQPGHRSAERKRMCELLAEILWIPLEEADQLVNVLTEESVFSDLRALNKGSVGQ